MIGWNTDTEGGVTNEELNRKISEAREPLRSAVIKMLDGEAWTEQDCWHAGYGWNTKPKPDNFKPRDWTGSEDASAVLLEEMPNPGISRGVLSMWSCIPDILDLKNEVQHKDRKTAIALAYLKWKGIE